MTPLVDSHCHLPLLAEFRNGMAAEEAVAGARANGVDWMLCVAVDMDSYQDVHACATRFDNVYASVGVHPCSVVAAEPTVDELAARAVADKVVAVGETGLDYFHTDTSPELQDARFRTHIRAARDTGRPLIIHSREARERIIDVLTEEQAQQVGGVMHCFVDDWDVASAAIDLGFLISFSGIVTFRNAEQVQAVARQIPADMMLVETDSPYLAPVPHRGKTNQPAHVRHVAEFIAGLRGESVDAVCAQTTENFFRLFSSAARSPAQQA